MPGDETLQKNHDDSESEEEDDDAVEAVPKVEIDPSTLTPLSPEVISKQVRIMWYTEHASKFYVPGHNQFGYGIV